MNKSEALKKLEEIHQRQQEAEDCFYGKCDLDHAEADLILIGFIDDEEISSAYQKIERWYY